MKRIASVACALAFACPTQGSSQDGLLLDDDFTVSLTESLKSAGVEIFSAEILDARPSSLSDFRGHTERASLVYGESI